jgi:hypothetical protein
MLFCVSETSYLILEEEIEGKFMRTDEGNFLSSERGTNRRPKNIA